MQNTTSSVSRGTQPPTPRWGYNDREHLEGLLISLLKVDERTAHQLGAMRLDDEVLKGNSRSTSDTKERGERHIDRALNSRPPIEQSQKGQSIFVQRRALLIGHESRLAHKCTAGSRSVTPTIAPQLRESAAAHSKRTQSRALSRNHRRQSKSQNGKTRAKLMRSNSNLQTPRLSLANSQFSIGANRRSSILSSRRGSLTINSEERTKPKAQGKTIASEQRCSPAAAQRQNNSNRISRDNMLFAERLVRINSGPGPYNRDNLLDYYVRHVF